ncbi:FRG domain-containing protein [Acinetobacter guillouiae]|uniref:FRG domain-containing protein n=1 Tax=Acinetobacter guillouiae TaxID=106649 RepID=UPI002E21A89B
MVDNLFNKTNKFNEFNELIIEDAEELISLLRPDTKKISELMTKIKVQELKLGYMPVILDELIYRGQVNSEWLLQPTVYRRMKEITSFFSGPSVDHHMEYNILSEFQKSCDLTGVQIPSDTLQIRKLQKKHTNKKFGYFDDNEEFTDWFDDLFYELAAFAQHFGVPTRLLDWSKNPFVASYFSSSEALKYKLNEIKFFSIWVLNIDTLVSSMDKSIDFLDLPKSINSHISHQQGVLSLTKFNNQLIKKYGYRPTISNILEYSNQSWRLLKINVPLELALELFDYCNSHNFNACQLFRGSHGAVSHTKDILNREEFLKQDFGI